MVWQHDPDYRCRDQLRFYSVNWISIISKIWLLQKTKTSKVSSSHLLLKIWHLPIAAPASAVSSPGTALTWSQSSNFSHKSKKDSCVGGREVLSPAEETILKDMSEVFSQNKFDWTYSGSTTKHGRRINGVWRLESATHSCDVVWRHECVWHGRGY